MRVGILIALKINLVLLNQKNKLLSLFFSFISQLISNISRQDYKDKFLWGHQTKNGCCSSKLKTFKISTFSNPVLILNLPKNNKGVGAESVYSLPKMFFSVDLLSGETFKSPNYPEYHTLF